MTYLLKKSLHWIIISLCIATVSLSARTKSKLKPGDLAPAFSLQGDNGKTYTFSDYNDQKVVLYFYPLDNSHYCTKQACSLAQKHDLYEKNNIKLFGINHQPIASHAAFKAKHDLPFTLLSDPKPYEVIKAYGAYSPVFIKRVTYLIDKGKIITILYDIDINNHADQILKAFDLLKINLVW